MFVKKILKVAYILVYVIFYCTLVLALCQHPTSCPTILIVLNDFNDFNDLIILIALITLNWNKPPTIPHEICLRTRICSHNSADSHDTYTIDTRYIHDRYTIHIRCIMLSLYYLQFVLTPIFWTH